MTRFAKLPLALLAVLAMLFLIPGLARADGTAGSSAGATDSSAPATSTDPSPASSTGTESVAPPISTAPQQNAVVPNAVTPNAVVPNAVTELPPPPCDPTHLTTCVDCSKQPAKSLPPCTTSPPPPPPSCKKLQDLPDCTPNCAFLASLLGHSFCTSLPKCLDPSKFPPNFPKIPGVPVCKAGGPSPTPPPGNSPGGVYYKNCADARAHGASNIHKGQPGYRPGLDRNHNGIACQTSTSTGTPQTSAAPAPKPVAAPVVNQLAYTGAVPAPVALAGFGLVLGGAGLLRLSRRPR